jgi:hypothetical protein
VSISVKSRVREDGVLRLDIPTGLSETDVEVLVVVQPSTGGKQQPENGGTWPEDFFERTFGCLKDDPIPLPSQDRYEVREKLN